jgi:hypothetical protein
MEIRRMEADWEFEVGGNAPAVGGYAPVIDAFWSGFVDLRLDPELAWMLAEAGEFPALAATLEKLNTRSSPVWTSKCDYWPELQPGEFDSDELDAPPGSSAHGAGCYIDLLPKENREWSSPHLAEAVCKRFCGALGLVPMRCCRVDLVIRRSIIAPEMIGLGISAYLTACGPTAGDAKRTLESALAIFGDALCPHSTIQ